MTAPVDLDAILAAGGAPRVGLLRYCAVSATMEPLFVYLVQEYRFRPTPAGALALYELFCAPGAPGRLHAYQVLPPRNLRLAADVAALRTSSAAPADGATPADGAVEDARAVRTPARELFDAVTLGVKREPDGPWVRVARAFDPARTAEELLPGGRPSPGQQQFRDKVWAPVIRPRLVEAGFWQVASIG